MRLLEFQGRELLRESGIRIPEGRIAYTPKEVQEIADLLDSKVVIKSQVPVGGRGKAGGIEFASSPEEARRVGEELLGLTIKGEKVEGVLVVEALEIEQEFYLSTVLDRAEKKPVLMFSTEGGVDIEQVAEEAPEAIQQTYVEPALGLQPFQVREILYGAQISEQLFKPLARVVNKVYECFDRFGNTLVEINPLAVTPEGELYALDSKVIVDDESREMENVQEIVPKDVSGARETKLEEKASEEGLQYVELEGNIGIIGNGAGLVMATLDVLSNLGGKPANFLDVGGGADEKMMEKAYNFVTSKEEVEGVFINIFGGITRCDEIARGLVAALKESGRNLPLVVRLTGTNEDRGREILSEADIPTADTLEEGAERIIPAIG